MLYFSHERSLINQCSRHRLCLGPSNLMLFCNNYVYLAPTVATFREIASRHIVAILALYELNGNDHYALYDVLDLYVMHGY